jgi:hypothetical protein
MASEENYNFSLWLDLTTSGNSQEDKIFVYLQSILIVIAFLLITL